jgi:hypothetical protein
MMKLAVQFCNPADPQSGIAIYDNDNPGQAPLLVVERYQQIVQLCAQLMAHHNMADSYVPAVGHDHIDNYGGTK